MVLRKNRRHTADPLPTMQALVDGICGALPAVLHVECAQVLAPVAGFRGDVLARGAAPQEIGFGWWFQLARSYRANPSFIVVSDLPRAAAVRRGLCLGRLLRTRGGNIRFFLFK